jgi:hypothetical protein
MCIWFWRLYTIPQNRYLTDEKELINRKLLYKTWMYYLVFHQYADDEERFYPKIKTCQYVDLNNDNEIIQAAGTDFDYYKSYVDDIHDDNPLSTVVRISDIRGFEIYYSTTGRYCAHNKCDIYGGKTEDNCCFERNYKCSSKGFLNFYDRKKQHSIFIPVYELNPDDDCGFSFRFFYISKDKNIHIFGGCSSTYYRSNNEYDCDKHVHLSKTHEIKITKDKEFIINKTVQNN